VLTKVGRKWQDLAKTTQRRRQLASRRGKVPMFDRGPHFEEQKRLGRARATFSGRSRRTGRGRFAADISFPQQLHMLVVHTDPISSGTGPRNLGTRTRR